MYELYTPNNVHFFVFFSCTVVRRSVCVGVGVSASLREFVRRRRGGVAMPIAVDLKWLNFKFIYGGAHKRTCV